MRYRLRTLLIVLAIVLPIVLIGTGICMRFYSGAGESSATLKDSSPGSAADVAMPSATQDAQSTIETSYDGVRFSMRLPPGWTWYDNEAFAINGFDRDIRGFLAIGRHALLRFDSEDLEPNAESAEAAAKQRLASLPDKATLKSESGTFETTIRDQRIIKVDGIDAVWKATSTRRMDHRAPCCLDVVCYLRCSGVDLIIKGDYSDYRPERTEEEVDKAQGELLGIIQSIRLNAE
jgi:hypothetical protein